MYWTRYSSGRLIWGVLYTLVILQATECQDNTTQMPGSTQEYQDHSTQEGDIQDQTTHQSQEDVTQDNTVICADVTCSNVSNCEPQDGATTPQCICKPYFYGDMCQFIDIQSLDYYVDETSITFYWNYVPELENYVSVSFKYNSNPLKTLHIYRLNSNRSGDAARTIKVDGLESGVTSRVCILHNDTLAAMVLSSDEQILRELDTDKRYCVKVKTGISGLSPYAKAAFGIGVGMAVLVLILMLFRAFANCKEKAYRERLLNDVLGTWHQVHEKLRGKLSSLGAARDGSHDDAGDKDDMGVHNVANTVDVEDGQQRV